MANFQQHVTCSTATGVVIGSGAFLFGVPLTTSIVAVGLCSLAGMLPDIDSKTSKSFKECIWSAGGLAAMLVASRLAEFEFSQEVMVICGVATFLFFRFMLGWILCKFTVHRGMLHSIPMAVIAGEITFLFSNGPTELRAFKAIALSAGFISHLILDEVFSITTVPGERIKRSFGTALKMIDYKHLTPTVLTYVSLLIVTGITMNESVWTDRLEAHSQKVDSFLEKVSHERVIQAEENIAGSPETTNIAQVAEKSDEPQRPQFWRLRSTEPAPANSSPLPLYGNEADKNKSTTANPSPLPQPREQGPKQAVPYSPPEKKPLKPLFGG